MSKTSRKIASMATAASLAGGVLLATSAAQAAFVEVRDGNGGDVFNGGPGAVGLTINVNGNNLGVSAGAFALQYRLAPGDPWTDFTTYCLEPDESLSLNGLTPVSGTLAADIASTVEYAGVANSVMRLYATWFADSMTSATKSAAFQVALWEITHDTGSDLGAGTFQMQTPGAVQTLAVSYLNPLGWALPGDLGVILRVGNQDLLIETEGGTTPEAIPEPGTLALLGLGLAGLAAARRRRARG